MVHLTEAGTPGAIRLHRSREYTLSNLNGHKPRPGRLPRFTTDRARAIDTGELLDLSDVGPAVGFTTPIAITAAACELAVIRGALEATEEQSERLMLIMQMARITVRQTNDLRPAMVIVGMPGVAEVITLDIHLGVGDHGEPVITICLPHEV